MPADGEWAPRGKLALPAPGDVDTAKQLHAPLVEMAPQAVAIRCHRQDATPRVPIPVERRSECM
jgi:hypothetical protein